MRRITAYMLVFFGLVVVLGGCGRRYHLSDEHTSQSRTLEQSETAFDGQLHVLWEDDFNSKPAGPLSIHQGVLAIPNAKRRIEFRATATGVNLGRVKTKGIAHTGLSCEDSLALFALEPPRGRVVCFDLKHHQERWRYPQRELAGVRVLGGNRALVATMTGTLNLVTLDSGESQWTFVCENRLVAPPVADDQFVYQSDNDGILYAISLADGEEVWRVDLGATIVAPVTISQRLYVTTGTGTVFALNAVDGGEVWRTQLSTGAWTAPAVAGNNIIVALAGGEVVALRADDGTEVWRFDTQQALRATPTVIDSIVLIATMRGRLLSLDVSDGRVIDQRDFGRAIDQSPVTDGQRIFIATRDGDIVCLGAN